MRSKNLRGPHVGSRGREARSTVRGMPGLVSARACGGHAPLRERYSSDVAVSTYSDESVAVRAVPDSQLIHACALCLVAQFHNLVHDNDSRRHETRRQHTRWEWQHHCRTQRGIDNVELFDGEGGGDSHRAPTYTAFTTQQQMQRCITFPQCRALHELRFEA